MRLAHVVPSLEARHGGPSRSVRALASAQGLQGATIELLTSGPRAATEAGASLTIRTFPRWHPEALCVVPALARHLRRNAFQIVHHHGLWLRTLHYARLHARRFGAPLIVSPRGMMSSWAWNHHRRRKAFAARVVHPGALDAVAGWHATSDAEAAEIRARGFEQPVCVAPNGVEIPTAEQLAIAREHWLEAVPTAAQRPTAVFYARFQSKKRVIELIDLWLARAPADWQLLMIGIPEEFSVAQLNHYVLRMLGSGRVLVFDGTLRPPPFAIGSLFVLPSHSENFGLSIAEALAAGVPALVTDTTPWQGLQTEGAGWCVPWDQYGDALQSALNEPLETLRERGARGRNWAQREFSWEQSARQLLAFYRTFLPR